MTHALQVLHTLQWHHPWWRALAQLAQAPTQDYHSYTHALLGGAGEEVTSPNGSPMGWQENAELLSVCGLTGTLQQVSLLGLRGKECTAECLLACTAHMSMESGSLLRHRQRRSYLFGVFFAAV